MTLSNLLDILKERTSRGIILHGFGCVTLYVPKKSAKAVEEYLVDLLPAAVDFGVVPLNRNMKKSVFEVGSVADKQIFEIIKRYKL